MKREYKLFLTDILENIGNIKIFTINMNFDDFKLDLKTIYSVTRGLEIIGEAISQIPKEIKLKNPQVNWKEIKGFRDKVIHKYWGIDLEIEWDVVTGELDILEKQIKEILKEEMK